jgi:hypothetical protein
MRCCIYSQNSIQPTPPLKMDPLKVGQWAWLAVELLLEKGNEERALKIILRQVEIGTKEAT